MAFATAQVPSAETSAPATGVPWYMWCGVLAVTSAAIGGYWDVSWHRSIGRDTFWTPAHMAIYACGVLAAVVCGYLIVATTFGRSPQLKASSVSVFGLRAPLGAFVAAWGGVAMLTSAPFDNWWHAAYGLDVKIVSPPHTLLILGVRAVDVGILFLLLALMNRSAAAGEANFKRLRWLFLYLGGLIVGGQMFFVMEFTEDIRLHTIAPYVAMAVFIPFVLAVLSKASDFAWAATATTSVYMLYRIGEILLLPLFPAQPKLGPVFNPVTHMVPAQFPILLVFPALALDLLWQRTRSLKAPRTWLVAAVAGAIFVAVLMLVEWPFANFLMSKWSANRFFGTLYFGYNTKPNSFERLRRFESVTEGWALWFGILRAMIYAAIGSWAGLRLGSWMKKVQR